MSHNVCVGTVRHLSILEWTKSRRPLCMDICSLSYHSRTKPGFALNLLFSSEKPLRFGQYRNRTERAQHTLLAGLALKPDARADFQRHYDHFRTLGKLQPLRGSFSDVSIQFKELFEASRSSNRSPVSMPMPMISCF